MLSVVIRWGLVVICSFFSWSFILSSSSVTPVGSPQFVFMVTDSGGDMMRILEFCKLSFEFPDQ